MSANGHESQGKICAEHLTVGYGKTVVMQDLDFTVAQGDIFMIMGRSGCGKSTLMKVLIGLNAPMAGRVIYDGVSIWEVSEEQREQLMRRFGVLYQGGALWSSMTLGENMSLPLRLYTHLPEAEIAEIVAVKLALVGLAGFQSHYPAELSGGMRKRAALARAMALDPDVLFFDEPSTGLDPVTARLLDELIVELSTSLGTTCIIVTHSLQSIFGIGTNGIFLDEESRTATAVGNPRRMAAESTDPKVRQFLTAAAAPQRAEGRRV